MSEILHMLVSRTTDYATRTKEFKMLELMEDSPALDHLDSPRVLNSHLYIAHLPEQLVEKKVKVSIWFPKRNYSFDSRRLEMGVIDLDPAILYHNKVSLTIWLFASWQAI